jgi:hypothetical protein
MVAVVDLVRGKLAPRTAVVALVVPVELLAGLTLQLQLWAELKRLRFRLRLLVVPRLQLTVQSVRLAPALRMSPSAAGVSLPLVLGVVVVLSETRLRQHKLLAWGRQA